MRYLKYKIVEFMEKESRIVVPGAGGWGECGVTVYCNQFHFGKMKNSGHSDDGCTTM